jgi:hypothetical protein
MQVQVSLAAPFGNTGIVLQWRAGEAVKVQAIDFDHVCRIGKSLLSLLRQHETDHGDLSSRSQT